MLNPISHKDSNIVDEKDYYICEVVAVFFSPGLQGSECDIEALRAQMKQAESKVEELAERLKNTTASMEQYKAMSLSLEESLDKEKQVCGMIKITIIKKKKNIHYIP